MAQIFEKFNKVTDFNKTRYYVFFQGFLIIKLRSECENSKFCPQMAQIFEKFKILAHFDEMQYKRFFRVFYLKFEVKI